MLSIKNYNIISENKYKYLSFPDIIKSKKHKNRMYLVFRASDGHHPIVSTLHLLISENNGITWKEINKFNKNLKIHKYVWNCPRLCYINNSLCIICDMKNHQNERKCNFKTVIMDIDENNFQCIYSNITEINGMVPDKIIKFKGNLYCANHIMDDKHGTLTQLVNMSRDNGATWYDCNILARHNNHAFCEASLINYNEKYLVSYMRDNIKDRNLHKYISSDGINWTDNREISICGHRATVLYENNRIFMSYRNTKEVGIGFMTAELNNRLEEKNIEKIQIENDFPENLYHCGYTGLEKCNDNLYIIVYYIKKDKDNPFIKSCFVEFKK